MKRAILLAVPALLVPSASGWATAGAADAPSTPQVVKREVIQADLDSSGKVDVARLFSQLTVMGNGVVHLVDPTSTKGLRNLDGFSTPMVRDGNAIYTIHVDGSTSRRTVSDFTKSLPVSVSAIYTLNGKTVKAGDIVGRTGDVTATYTITNISGTPTTLTWKDGKGVEHSVQEDLVTPYVGQVQTTLPGSFSRLVTPAADVSADGRGGTILTYSMVLFDPLGATTQKFSWQGHVKNGRVPEVTVQVVPVSPTNKPELNVGVIGYRDGSTQAGQLTAGAGLIDANLLKLQSGAGDLLAGLTKLAAGADQLRDGLSAKLGPGASQLASGAAAAKTGSGQLRTGLGALSSGATRLSSGIGTAKSGSSALAAGISQLLTGVQGLPSSITADPGYQKLVGALTSVEAAIGSPSDVTPTTLLGGLNLITYGLRSPVGPSSCTPSPGSPTSCGAIDAVQLVQEQLAAAVATGGSLDGLIASATAAYAGVPCPTAPGTPIVGVIPPTLLPPLSECQAISNLVYGLGLPAGVVTPSDPGGLKAQTSVAAATLQAAFQGVDNAIIPGIAQVKAGLSNPACSLADPSNPANPCGIRQVQSLVAAGVGQLVSAISSQLSGVLSQANTGAAALSGGLSQLATGGQQVAAGAGKAASGANALDGGLGKIATGAGQLSGGVGSAVDGSNQLADGLDRARSGDSDIVGGAGLLRSQGTSKLVSGANDTTSDAARKYAELLALQNKVADGALPYAAPAGATGSAAYQLTLAASDTSSQDNTKRGAAAVLLLVAACAVSWFLSRQRGLRQQ